MPNPAPLDKKHPLRATFFTSFNHVLGSWVEKAAFRIQNCIQQFNYGTVGKRFLETSNASRQAKSLLQKKVIYHKVESFLIIRCTYNAVSYAFCASFEWQLDACRDFVIQKARN